MKKLKVKFATTAIALMLSIILVISGLNKIAINSKSAIAQTTDDNILQLSKLRELEENVGNEMDEGKIISSDNKILWEKEFNGYEDTFSLIGIYRDGTQLSNNTITYKYKDTLLPDINKYNFKDGIQSMFNSTGDIMLSLNHKINSMIYNYMKKNKANKASALLVDINTGATIASVSLPSIKPTTSVQISSLQEGSLVNKNLSDLCFPGSTEKISTTVVLSELIGNEIDNLNYICNGKFILKNGGAVTCSTSKGRKDISSAIGTSCNSFFANTTQNILDNNKKKTIAYYKKIGYAFGNVEYTNLDKLSRVKSLSEYNGDGSLNNVWSTIGEQSVKVNAYDMTNLVSAILNGGEYTEPYIVQNINYKNGKKIVHKPKHKKILSKKAARIVLEKWKEGFDKYYSLNSKVLIAKTGTAEIETTDKNGKRIKKDSSLLLGCMKIKEKKVAFFINIEDYKSSKIKASDVAEYIAGNIG